LSPDQFLVDEDVAMMQPYTVYPDVEAFFHGIKLQGY
jgi:hypothetical protein